MKYLSANPFHGWIISRIPHTLTFHITCPNNDCSYKALVSMDNTDLGALLDRLHSHMGGHTQSFFIRPTL